MMNLQQNKVMKTEKCGFQGLFYLARELLHIKTETSNSRFSANVKGEDYGKENHYNRGTDRCLAEERK